MPSEPLLHHTGVGNTVPAFTMINGFLYQIVLLLSFTSMALFKSCSLLQLQQSSLACQKLLAQLTGRPEHCLDDRMDFKLPEEIKNLQQSQKVDTSFVVYEMLKNIFEIFRKDTSNTGWDVAIIKKLFTELNQQLDRLEKILERKIEEENLTWGNVRTFLRLKSYYWNIVRYLKNKEYSICAWTIVQVEILRNFSFINSLTEGLEN
ncbi:PREDICTED: interferon beta [Dipodomys ordii]|uniref:Interferon beta n=1 Tax=Dipodomys ordii TaxID=10020 RepID=A0A1S3FHZ2_DIPOR|nr:PREDICTED: interferon beta [Dipodomys ordii]CAB0000213.1 TPA: interferon 1DA1 [Dipodomys ordii]